MKEELQEERKQKKKSRPVKDDIVPGSGDAEPGRYYFRDRNENCKILEAGRIQICEMTV